MKKCPQCGSTYQDDTLSFCLSDGTAINSASSGYSPEETLQLPEEQVTSIRQNQARVQVPVNQPTFQSTAPAAVSNTFEKKGSNMPMILAGVALLGLLLLGAAAFAYVIISNRGNVVAQNPTPTPIANTNPPANEKDKTEALQEEVNKLKKMIEDQANANKKVTANKPVASSSNTSSTPAPASEIKIATVNSPGDGFLAMRSLPNSETGERIMKIPTGATVAVGNCLPYAKSGKMKGRWCRVAYSGQTGWAFDAYLIY